MSEAKETTPPGGRASVAALPRQVRLLLDAVAAMAEPRRVGGSAG